METFLSLRKFNHGKAKIKYNKLFLLFILSVSLNSLPGLSQDFDEEYDIDKFLGEESLMEDLPGYEISEQEEEFEAPEEIEKLEELRTPKISRRKIKTKEKIKKHKAKKQRFLGAIKARSTIYHLKDEKYFIVNRSINVNYEMRDNDPFSAYLIDKSGRIKYVTHLNNIYKIKNDLGILPTPKVIETYPPPDIVHLYDQHLSFFTEVKLHYEIVNFNLITGIVNEYPDATFSNRIEFETFLKWNFPIYVGLNFNFQQGAWLKGTQGLNWDSLYIGPSLRINILDKTNYSLMIGASFQQCLYGRLYDPDSEKTFSARLLQYDLSIEYKQFLIGMNYRLENILIKDGFDQYTITDDMKLKDSVGFSIGYKFNFKI